MVTETVPVVPNPTTATITVPVLEVIEETAVPPILTLAAVAPVKLVPLIVIDEPTHPIDDPKLVMTGGAVTQRFVRFMSELNPTLTTLM